MTLDAFASRLHAAAEPDAQALGVRVADTIGALLTASALHEAAVLAELDASASATLFAAATIRASELDDIELLTCTTQSAVVVPAALAALGSAAPAPATFARALAAGYATMFRRAEPIGGVAALARGIWPTLLAAPAAAAAAAAVAFELPPTGIATALRLASLCERGRAGATIPPLPSRWWLFGAAVADGVAAARASAAGLTADPHVDLPLGRGLQAARTSQKSFPAARQGANAVVAFRDLLREHAIDPATIEAVRVGVPSGCVRVIAQSYEPANRLARIAGAGLSLAAAAYDDAVLRSVDREPPLAPSLLALAARVDVRADEELDAMFPQHWPARVVVVLRDGATFERLQTTIAGDPESPFTLDDLARKYAGIARDVLDDAAHATTDAAALGRTLERVLATRERARRRSVPSGRRD